MSPTGPCRSTARMFWLESVANALEQAKQAAGRDRRPAAAAAGGDLELVGPVRPQAAVRRPAVRRRRACWCAAIPATAKFAVFHLKGDVIQAVEAVNAPAEFMAGRQLIGAQAADRRGRGLRIRPFP